MQTATITEDVIDARRKYAEYLKAVKERHNDEYEALKNAYRELSRGKQVIDLVETMRQAGTDPYHRPKLAAIRADCKLCHFHWDSDRGPMKPTFSPRSFRRRTAGMIQLPATTFDTPARLRWQVGLRAIVPTIPPSLMPKGKLSRYVILWEAEWERVPVDPMLLAPLGKHLYRVLATWDLTPLERAVLSDRL